MHFHSVVEQEQQLKFAQAVAYGRAFGYKEGQNLQKKLVEDINNKLGIKPEPMASPLDMQKAYEESVRVPSFMINNNT
jgi:hypothetical protein